MAFDSAMSGMSRYELTENGDIAFATTGEKLLDYYDKCVRGVSVETLTGVLDEILLIDGVDYGDLYATIFNVRDARHGKGERLIFYRSMYHLWTKESQRRYVRDLLSLIPEYGYYKDFINMWELSECDDFRMAIVESWGTSMRMDMEKYGHFVDLSEEEKSKTKFSMAWKYAPAEKSAHRSLYKALREYLKIPKSTYRKTKADIGRRINIVEQMMCGKMFAEIKFSAVPSKAMNLYKKAFMNVIKKRHMSVERSDELDRVLCAERFKEYIERVSSGEEKINVKTMMPHELVRQYFYDMSDDKPVLEVQWKALREHVMAMGDFSKELSLCVCDVSGSMAGIPMEVCISLGIMISSIQPKTSPFADRVITFQSKPSYHMLDREKSLHWNVKKLASAPWGGTTNFYLTMKMIAGLGQKHGLTQDQMPKRLFIFSDMQFNSADRNSWSGTYAKVTELFDRYGYVVPQIIFWNLRGNTVSYVEDAKTEGVAMLSGFSTTVLKSLLDGDSMETFTPLNIFKKIITDTRYDLVRRIVSA